MICRLCGPSFSCRVIRSVVLRPDIFRLLLITSKSPGLYTWYCRVTSGAVDVQSAECQSLQPPHVAMATGITDASPSARHVDVVLRRASAAAAASDIDDDDDDDDDDDAAVTSHRGAPASSSSSYLRHARMSICKMTTDYLRRLPSARTRRDRSATRRERKATKTLAIVLGQSAERFVVISFTVSLLAHYFRRGVDVFTLFVCLFVSRITPRLLNRVS